MRAGPTFFLPIIVLRSPHTDVHHTSRTHHPSRAGRALADTQLKTRCSGGRGTETTRAQRGRLTPGHRGARRTSHSTSAKHRTLVVVDAVGEVAEELAGLGADGVDAGGPDLDAAVQSAGGSLKVDGVVIVVAEEGHVVEVVDEGKVPRIRGIDFLRHMR